MTTKEFIGKDEQNQRDRGAYRNSDSMVNSK